MTELDPDGGFVYSTYLGGTRADSGEAIAVDEAGNAYVTGYTNSDDFPSVNALPPQYRRGYQDAFVTKINPDGSALLYSTQLGGSEYEYRDRHRLRTPRPAPGSRLRRRGSALRLDRQPLSRLVAKITGPRGECSGTPRTPVSQWMIE